VKKLFVRSRGYCEKNGEDFAFVEAQVHHRDRNRENNKMDNLLLLCPNCHSMLHYNFDGSLKKKDLDIWQEFACYQP
jgi:phage pi2 protein 07